MDIIERMRAIIGDAHVLTGKDCARWAKDWTGKYHGQPLAVLRPASTVEVSQIMRLASETGAAVVPASGNTGLVGGTHAPGRLVLSVDRMRAIREIRPGAQLAIVDAGVVLANLHSAVAEHGLVFPVTLEGSNTLLLAKVALHSPP